MLNKSDWRQLEQAHIIYGWQAQRKRSPLVFERGERVFLWDGEGNRFLDFGSGQINVNVGYGHPKVIAAIKEQTEKLTYVAPYFATEPRVSLAAQIANRTPGDLNHIFFTNSGSESVETAVKVARAVTKRFKVMSAWQSYHGMSAGASAISGDPRRHFVEPTMPGLSKFHYPGGFRSPFGAHKESDHLLCVEALRSQIVSEGPETIAAIVIEPITGTSGLYVPSGIFIESVRELCDRFGILLIADETMTGWGRTGRWFACEHYGLVPDILTTAKGLTSGYVPLGAVAIRSHLMEVFSDKPFVGGLTNEGHTLGCAAGLANIAVYEEEHLIERSDELGKYLLKRLMDLKARHPSVGDVRGQGLFCCLELTKDREQRTALAGYRDEHRNVSDEIFKRCLAMGLLVMAKWDFLFIAPPLVIERGELDEGLEKIDRVLEYTDSLL